MPVCAARTEAVKILFMVCPGYSYPVSDGVERPGLVSFISLNSGPTQVIDILH